MRDVGSGHGGLWYSATFRKPALRALSGQRRAIIAYRRLHAKSSNEQASVLRKPRISSSRALLLRPFTTPAENQ